MNQENKHTALPWISESIRMSGKGKHSIFRPCITAGNKIIADMCWPGIGAMEAEKAERAANVAFILEACNNYAQMKDALQDASLALIAATSAASREGNANAVVLYREIGAKARAVLCKAAGLRI